MRATVPMPKVNSKRASGLAYCWGAQLQGTDRHFCAGGHVKGDRHFKTKFCANCKAQMVVPLERVRCLSRARAAEFTNNHANGLWTLAAPKYGAFCFRIINHTAKCQPPLLIVFKEPPPDNDAWTPLPASLHDGDGFVRLCMSKGTIVPVQHRRLSRHTLALLPSPSPSPSPPSSLAEGDEEQELAPRAELVPCAPMKLPPSEPQPAPCNPLGERKAPTLASYNESRMQRNRQSAARSRLAKRQHIERLERTVLELQCAVEQLRKENWYLRSLQTVNLDDALHIDWKTLDAIEC